MTSKILFSQPAFLEVQGVNVLELLEISTSSVNYKVIGFQSPSLYITDFRNKVNLVLKELVIQDDLSNFIYSFCGPAHVSLEQQLSGDLIMNLYDTNTNVPDYMAWLVIGIEGEIPEYTSDVQVIQQMGTNSSAALVIYPLEPEKMVQFIALSKSTSNSQL